MNSAEFETEMRNLLATIQRDENAYIFEKTPEYIIVQDMLKEKDILYRLKPHTEGSLTSIIKAGSGVNLTENQRHAIARRLMNLSPETLLNLRNVQLVRTYEDLHELTTELGVDDELIPETALEDECVLDNDTCGVSWDWTSSVIINIAAIELAAKDVTSDCPGLYQNERDVGFWVTLLHEIRHNQNDNMPYDVPWLKKSDSEEAAVEAWAVETYETIF